MRIMPFMKRKKGVQFAGTGLDIGGGGTTDYTELSNKPQINGVTLTGNKTLSDLGIQGEIKSASFTSTTNSDGQFGIGNLPANNCTILAIKPISISSSAILLPYIYGGRYYATAFFVGETGLVIRSNVEISGIVYYIEI